MRDTPAISRIAPRDQAAEFALPKNGLVTNIVSFNVGVEIGQLLALTAVLIGLRYWRTHPGFLKHAFATNAGLMACGFLLVGYQLSGYVSAASAGAPSEKPAAAGVYKIDASELKLGPRDAFEYKYRLDKGASMVFAWKATGRVKYEFHGDPDDPTASVETYQKQRATAPQAR